tara:strand:+ start:615 stop:818 length:204 start_codon:yes stop_codon:yes gene_type:complete
MSGEQLSAKELHKGTETDTLKSKVSKVNINHLLSKIRAEKTKERKENYMFLGLVVAVLAVTGIIASL